MTKKQVTKTENQLPDYIKTDVSRGNENITNDDLQLPRIDVHQALSPQVFEDKPEYIEGAKVGMLFNTLTGELYPEGISVTPVMFTKRYLVWVNRKKDKDGGLISIFESADEAESFLETHEDQQLAEKCEIVPTHEHLVLLDDGTEVIVSLAKSKTKVSRKWNSLIRLNGNDRFSRKYKIGSVLDKSAQGEFMNLTFESDGFPSQEVYQKAETLYDAIQSGKKKMASGNYEGSDGDTGEVDKTEY